ncbi:MAG: hypothetical protein HKO59_16670 [Phycisphaerales bacterium]|nr:hypothetical protein [Phycisphaerales bacterium]
MARSVRRMQAPEVAAWRTSQLGDRIRVHLGHGQPPIAVIDRTGTQRGYRTRSGSIEGHPFSRFTVVERDGITAGVFTLPDLGTFQIRTQPDGSVVMIELDQEAAPGCGTTDGMLAIDPGDDGDVQAIGDAAADGGGGSGGGGSGGSGGGPTEPDGPCDDGSIIDVLIAYTPAARTSAGGIAAIEAEAVLSIAASNDAYANSDVAQRLRLVHLLEVSYTESTGNYSQHLSRLRSTTDGIMDNLHSLRDSYGADMVSLFVNDGQYCGLAYLMSTPGAYFEANAFSVVTWTCAAGYYSFAHELGHNMGLCHDHDNCSGGAYPYSYGHRFYAGAGQYRTVMAYAPGLRIQWFSNPDVLYGGTATGVPGTGPTAADNARSMDETALTVANFRCGLSSTGEYIGAAGGSWLDPSNWGGGAPPDGSVDVVLDTPVVIDGPGAVANSVTLTSGATLTLSTSNATLGAATVTVNSGTTLAGIGTITGDIVNGGTVAPGNSPGTLTITGGYTQLVTGRLNIEVDGYTAGSEHDALAVSGTATLDGAVAVTTGGSFTPALSTATFLTGATVTGAFAAAELPALAGAFSFSLATTGSDASLVTVGIDSCHIATSAQWATSVIDYSSQWSTSSYAATQVLGPPDVASYENSPLAWAASSQDGTTEYVTVGFDDPVYATGVIVRETWGPGFVTRVDVVDTNDVLQTVWTGTDTSPAGAASDFKITWAETEYLVDGVRIYIDTDATSTWEEIDAIRLLGVPGPTSVPAERVIDFSSQWSTGDFSAAQTLGVANVPGYVNHPSAWAASSKDGTQEYVTVGVNTPMFATGVTVRETYGNGFVTQIDVVDLDDQLHTVWTGTDASAPGTPVEFQATWTQTGFPVQGVRVHVNTDATSTWEEIDAITLHGVPVSGGAWVSAVVDYSSQYAASGFSATQILGPPDVPAYGNSPLAWAPSSQDGTLEYVTLEMPDPMYTTGVTVRETWGNGFVYKVEVLDTDGVLQTVWTGTDPSTPGAIADFQIQWAQTSYLGTAVRIHVDTDATTDWEEIDAVLVHGARRVENDCNGNGVNDACDIANGTSLDANLDGIPDECVLAPTVDSLDPTPNPVAQNQSVTLVATNAADGNGDLDHVDFYFDADDDGELTGADTLIGTDNAAAGGWSWTEAASGYAQADHRFFARAEDTGGRQSAVVATVVTVDPPFADGAYVGSPGGSWFTPASWGDGGLPDASTVVTIATSVVVDAAGAVASTVTIQSGGTLTVEAGADLTATTIAVEAGGTLAGAGALAANVVNHGTVAPGDNLGTLTITGNYTQETSGTLAIEVDGYTASTQHDVLAVSATAALDGELSVTTLGSFTPALDTATFLTAASVTGSFAGTELPDLAGAFSFTYVQSATDGGLVTVGEDSCRVASVVQWASSVVDYSSQFTSTSYAATQTLGAPDVAAYGNSTSAWAASTQDGTLEYLTLGFDQPVYATGVMIRETYGNGMVYRVDVVDTDDVLHTVWTGTDSSTPGAIAEFLVEWDETDYLVDGVKIYIDTDATVVWEEIDAVQLRGVPAPITAYASAVLGSSSEWSSSAFSAAQTLGPSDVTAYGNNPNAWAASSQDGTLEYVTLGFPTPMYASGVTVRETWGTGFIYQVDVLDLDDVLHTVWTGTDPSAPGTAADTFFGWTETGFPVKGVKLYVDTDATTDWEEIDCVQLHGVPAPTGVWASSVEDFSSQYSATAFSAARTLGQPDVLAYGNNPLAWAASSQDGTLEYLTLGFPTSMYATGVTIRETLGNGFVYQIDAIDTDDVATTVWTGVDPSTAGDVAEFRVSWTQTTYLVKAVKVYIDTDATATWEEVDAVQLHGVIVVDGDCNGNGVADACDIEAGTSLDTNVNGIPDECEPPPDEPMPDPPAPDMPAPDAPATLALTDSAFDLDTLAMLLSQMGTCVDCSGDLDGNGVVDTDDLLALVGGGLPGGDPAPADDATEPTLANDAVIAPAETDGLVTIAGDHRPAGDDLLLIEVGGLDPVEEHDLLVVGGDAQLDGTLVVFTTGGFELLEGEEIVVIAAGSVTGTFTEVVLPGAPGSTELVYRDGAVVVRGTGTPASAVVFDAALDLDGSGRVDAADVLALLDDWNQTLTPADLDGSGFVDVVDLAVLLAGVE